MTHRHSSHTVRENIDACIAKIEAENPSLNAVSALFTVDARKQADLLDKSVQDGHAVGPLHGVPVLLKELVDIAGHVTGFGSVAYSQNAAVRNAPVVDRLKAAGAIILGTTNMVEFAVGSWGTNAVQGTPWNPADRTNHRAPGGSSSGSAVAVAAGFSPIAFGSDTGGSIRIPATLCGLVGFKPSYGLIPLQGVAATGPSFDTLGPITTSVADARRAAEAAACRPLAHPPVSLSKLRIAHVSDAALQPIDKVCLESYRRAHKQLRVAGAEMIEIELPLSFVEMQQINGDIIAYEAYRQLKALVEDDTANLDPFVRQRVLFGASVSDEQYRQVYQDLHNLKSEFLERFSAADVLLIPGTPLPAPTLDEVDESQIPMSRFTRCINCLDLCAIALPVPALANELPTGIQLVMRPGQDAQLLSIAEAFEQLNT